MSHRLGELPFVLGCEVPSAKRREIAEAALAANDRYVIEFLESYALCPYARSGRERGVTERRVHFAETADSCALAQAYDEIAPGDVEVLQIIFPLVKVEPADFSRFVYEVTEALNARQPRPLFASAALHPGLAYTRETATGLISLFRRAPDPTLQWVRLATLDHIYRGRKGGTSFVDPKKLGEVLGAPVKRDLYDEIARTNQATAEQMGLDGIEGWLGALHTETQQAYQSILASS